MNLCEWIWVNFGFLIQSLFVFSAWENNSIITKSSSNVNYSQFRPLAHQYTDTEYTRKAAVRDRWHVKCDVRSFFWYNLNFKILYHRIIRITRDNKMLSFTFIQLWISVKVDYPNDLMFKFIVYSFFRNSETRNCINNLVEINLNLNFLKFNVSIIIEKQISLQNLILGQSKVVRLHLTPSTLIFVFSKHL